MRFRSRRLLGAVAVVAVATALGAPGRADAHPLGNLTNNTAAAITVSPDHVSVEYVLDLAELPTVQARQAMDRDADGQVSTAEADAYRVATCASLADGLALSVGGTRAPLTAGTTTIAFPPGQAGLVTTRLVCSLTAPVDATRPVTLTLDDRNLTDRVGWREITAIGDGTTLTTDLPTASSSQLLTAYPTGVSPPRVLHAEVRAVPGGARVAGAGGATGAGPTATSTGVQARGADGLTQRFQRLVGSHRLTTGLLALAIALAFVLGALHAMAPGHGKTLMAAAVVARRGTTRQVLGIGATVTVTHTAGVLVLGTIIWVSDAVAPDRLLPWLTVASGVLVVGLGLTMLVRRVLLGRPAHGHHHHGLFGHTHDDDHAHDDHAHDDHAHHGHDHPHPHPHDDHGHDGHDHPAHHGGRVTTAAAPALTRRWIVTMGIAGGLVPTPSALVVLLGAAALGRAWLGVVLVAIYGIGMAATLLVAGIALVRLQAWLERHWYDRSWLRLAMRVAPMVTAVVLVAGGASIIVRGALSV